jgi:hypothetical protein
MGERPDPIAGAMRRGFDSMVRRGLRGIWRRGQPPAGPFVWAANHHSWWDPFVGSVLLDRDGRRGSLLMLQENLVRFGFVRRLGVFGTHECRRGLGYLAEGRVLIVYPEGELRPPGPVGDLSDGASWYARRAGVPLCAVATRVVLRGHEAPEAYVCYAVVAPAGSVSQCTARLAERLSALLSEVDGQVASGNPRAPLPEFAPVMRGRRSWDERIETMARWQPWRV